jgi:hypothetical protein
MKQPLRATTVGTALALFACGSVGASGPLSCDGGTFSIFRLSNLKNRSYTGDTFTCQLADDTEGVIWVAVGEGFALADAEKKLVFKDEKGREFGHTCWTTTGEWNGVVQTEVILFGPEDSRKITVCCQGSCADAQVMPDVRPNTGRSSTAQPMRTRPDSLSLQVADDYRPVIPVPACDKAIEDGLLQGATFSCFESEKGEYVGDGRTWLLPGDERPISMSIYGYPGGRLDIKIADGQDEWNWEVSLEPPSRTPWRAGLFEDANGGDEVHPGLRVSRYTSGPCSELAGRFEILEFVYDNASDTVTSLAVNLEQDCVSRNKSLRGYIRFNSTVAH